MLKIFADECIHTDVILALRNRSIDVLTVKEAGLTGAEDEVIFNFALDSGRTILTFDRGFGDIFRFSIQKSSGIIIVLVGQMSKEEIPNIILNFIDFLEDKGLRGKLIIIGKSKIRIYER